MNPPSSHSAVDESCCCRLFKAMGKFCGCYPSSGINDTNPTEQIVLLKSFIQDKLRAIKTPSEASIMGIQLGTVSSGIDIGGQIVDTISKQAEKLKKEVMYKC
ncbi:uncharacterized protein LOC131858739 [Cryptomeria japonica]|uniref:uncharacterized protein LOC131858739 n=1 Tax=Cryptomeria japonica TaxID=3369 RepID=UPI0027D9F1D3|nr:uncharacterized protein LOC131858739 [Cryptomeria japonica]